MKKRDFKVVSKVILCQIGTYLTFKIIKKTKGVVLRVLQKSEIIASAVNRADMYEKWIENTQKKKRIGECLGENGVKNVVICVWNKTTELLVNEIKHSVNIKYIVDADRDLDQPFEVIDSLDRVDNNGIDLIVVMEPEAYDDYYREFHNEFRCPIVSIDELIAEL